MTFAQICININPQNPKPRQLWDEFHNPGFIDDFVRNGDSIQTAISKALQVSKFNFNF